jgi:hypothetical protein
LLEVLEVLHLEHEVTMVQIQHLEAWLLLLAAAGAVPIMMVKERMAVVAVVLLVLVLVHQAVAGAVQVVSVEIAVMQYLVAVHEVEAVVKVALVVMVPMILITQIWVVQVV